MFASSRPSAAKPHATSESFLVWTQTIVSNLSVLNRNWAVFPSHCHQALLIGLWVLEVYFTCLQATAVVNQRCINTTDLNYFQSFCFVFCYFAFACRMTSIWLFHAGLSCRSQRASQFPIQKTPHWVRYFIVIITGRPLTVHGISQTHACVFVCHSLSLISLPRLCGRCKHANDIHLLSILFNVSPRLTFHYGSW